MPDPRTTLLDLLATLTGDLVRESRERDLLWADYWRTRRVVVVPDNGNRNVKEGDAHHAVPGELQRLRSGPADLTRPGDEPGRGLFMSQRVWETTVIDCIARLKAAREKDAVNKNLSTLLAVVVKVQRDLEALLNGKG